MTDKKPERFEDLPVAELRRSAIEDFAVSIEPDESKKSVVAALFESGVTWDDYVAQHPEVKPDEPADVVKSSDVASTSQNVLSVEDVPTPEPVKPRVQEGFDSSGPQPYLIKMTRENPLYQTRGYTFTKEHPYALVTPADAQYILSREDGFRQAFPDELEEFYS